MDFNNNIYNKNNIYGYIELQNWEIEGKFNEIYISNNDKKTSLLFLACINRKELIGNLPIEILKTIFELKVSINIEDTAKRKYFFSIMQSHKITNYIKSSDTAITSANQKNAQHKRMMEDIEKQIELEEIIADLKEKIEEMQKVKPKKTNKCSIQ